jgi:hypothetical protein
MGIILNARASSLQLDNFCSRDMPVVMYSTVASAGSSEADQRQQDEYQPVQAALGENLLLDISLAFASRFPSVLMLALLQS